MKTWILTTGVTLLQVVCQLCLSVRDKAERGFTKVSRSEAEKLRAVTNKREKREAKFSSGNGS